MISNTNEHKSHVDLNEKCIHFRCPVITGNAIEVFPCQTLSVILFMICASGIANIPFSLKSQIVINWKYVPNSK